MYFQSFGFLFFFLPVVLITVYLLPKGWPKRLALLSFSYLFYSGNEPFFLILLIISSVVDYFIALKIHSTSVILNRRFWLTLSIILNLGLLGFYKYGAFFLEIIQPLQQYIQFPLPNQEFFSTFVLPAGISFYTFQSMSYSLDVYRKKTLPTKNILGFFNYVSYLPQLIAGPIERFNHLSPQLENFFNGELKGQWNLGLNRLALGIFQKLVIADSCGRIVDSLDLNSQRLELTSSWLFGLSFGMQIFYDFCSYTNMAIGISLLFGIQLSENFLSPYKSVSIQDFWRKWHITLSSWLRDYVYFSLGGSKHGFVRMLLSILITFVLIGLWHGAGYNFLLWGSLHAVFLMIFHIYNKLFPRIKFPIALSVFITFIAVTFAWVPFRVADMSTIIKVWEAMVGLNGINFNLLSIYDYLFVLLIVMFTMVLPNSAERWPGKSGFVESVCLWILAIVSIISSPQTFQFIYFQF